MSGEIDAGPCADCANIGIEYDPNTITGHIAMDGEMDRRVMATCAGHHGLLADEYVMAFPALQKRWQR